MDHLEGKLFVDYLSSLKRERIRRRLEKERRERGDAPRARPGARSASTGKVDLAIPIPIMLRIAFAGTPHFALPALDALAASAHRLVGVLTQPDRPAGRGRAMRASPVKQRALALGIPVAQPERLAADADRAALRDWQPELLVVVAYGLILPRAVLELPRLGCLNIHASLLPRWRGAAPIQRAILAGDSQSGVTIMQMDAGLDTGPILAQRSVPIASGMSSAVLHDVLAQPRRAIAARGHRYARSGRRNTPRPAGGRCYATRTSSPSTRR